MHHSLCLEYELELPEAARRKILEALGESRLLGEGVPSKIAVVLGEHRMLLDNGAGLSLGYDYRSGEVVFSLGGERRRSMPAKELLAAVNGRGGLRCRWRGVAREKYPFGDRTLPLEGYLFASTSRKLDVEAITRGLRYPPEALSILWSVLAGGTASPVAGIPVRVAARELFGADEVLSSCKLVTAESREDPDDRPGEPGGAEIESRPLSLGSLVRKGKRVEKRGDLPRRASRSGRSLLFQLGGGWVGSYLCKVGGAFGDDFLAQLEGYVNRVVGNLGMFEGRYSGLTRLTSIPIQLWPLLSGRLKVSGAERDALESLVVAGVLLIDVFYNEGDSPGQALVRAVDREDGLTAEEAERLMTLKSIFDGLENGGALPWSVSGNLDDSIPSEVVDEVLGLLNAIRTGSTATGAGIDRETASLLALLLMVGILDDTTYVSLDVAAAFLGFDLDDLEHVVFERREARRAEFVQAQLGEMLDLSVEVDGDFPIVATSIAAVTAYLSHVQIGLTGDLLADLRVEDDAVRANVTVPWLFIDVRVPQIRLHHGMDVVKHLAAAATLGLTYLFTEASGNLQLALQNTTLPLRLRPVEAEGGIGFELATDGQVTWANAADADVIAHFPFPVGEIIIAFSGDIRNAVRGAVAPALDGAFDSVFRPQGEPATIIPWPAMLRLREAPVLRSFFADEDVEVAWGAPRTVWATLVGEAEAGADGTQPGDLDLSDVDELGYVFTPCILGAWMGRLLGDALDQQRVRYAAARGWAEDAGVELPALASYDVPADAELDSSTMGTLAGAAILHLLARDPEIGSYSETLENLCGSAPPVNPPSRFLQLRLVPFAPQIEVGPDGEAAHAGSFVIRYELFYEAMLRQHYRLPTLSRVEGTPFGVARAGDSGDPERIVVDHDHPDYEEQSEHHHESGDPLDPLGDLDAGYATAGTSGGGAPADETECEWSEPITREYLLETLLHATGEITGRLRVGFTEGDDPLDAAEPLTLLVPTLGLAPERDEGGPALDTRNVEIVAMDNAFADLARDEVEELIGETILEYFEDRLAGTPFDESTVTGVHHTFSGLPSMLLDFQPQAIRDARLVQPSSASPPDADADPDPDELRYVHRNGHVIWPVSWRLDLDSMI